VLRRMGRHWYTSSGYARAIEQVVAGRTPFGLGADIIAGFPGESDNDHRLTLDLVASLPFTYLHVFTWSPRPGTAAERLTGRVGGEVAARRARELRDVGADAAARHRARRSGGIGDLVVLGTADRRTGLTEDYLDVALAEPRPPRGMRLRARLDGDAAQLIATPL